MRKWLSRLAFSFMVLSAVLWWAAFKHPSAGHLEGWRWIDALIAAVLTALAAVGLRLRHS